MIYYLRGTVGWLLVAKPIVALISTDRKVLESTNKAYWRELLWWRQNPVDQPTETLKLPTQLHHYWLVFPVQLMGTVEKKLKKRCWRLLLVFEHTAGMYKIQNKALMHMDSRNTMDKIYVILLVNWMVVLINTTSTHHLNWRQTLHEGSSSERFVRCLHLLLR